MLLLAGVLERVSERLPAMAADSLRDQWARVLRTDEEIAVIERRLQLWHRGNEASRRVAEIPGVGLLTATAAVATMGDRGAFRSGREFAAFLGLVPRHSGTGGRVGVLGISKRGDPYLRSYPQLLWQPSGKLEVHYINVGQGGSTLIIGPDGTRILYDFGNVRGDRDIVPYLRDKVGLAPQQGLQFTIVSHRDTDHYVGYREVIEAGYDIIVANYDSGSSKTSLKIRKRWLAARGGNGFWSDFGCSGILALDHVT